MEGPQPPVVDRLAIARGGSAQYYDRRLPATLLHPFPIRPSGWYRQVMARREITTQQNFASH